MLRKLRLLVLFFLLASSATAQKSRSELEKERAGIQAEIEEIQSALKEVSRNRKTLLNQVSLLQRKLRLRTRAVSNINQEIRAISDEIYLSALEIRRLKGELDTLKLHYAQTLVYAYKYRSNYDFLNFVFSASNFNDVIRRVAYFKAYKSYREKKVEEIERTRIVLQEKIDALKIARKEKDKALEDARKERAVLADEKREQDKFVSVLRTREKELNGEIYEKRAQIRKVQETINSAIRTELNAVRAEEKSRSAREDKSTSTALSGSGGTAVRRAASEFENTPEGVISSSNFEKNRGQLPWPVETGTVIYHFGRNAVAGMNGITLDNNGLTIQTPIGQPVKAIFDGEVISVSMLDAASGAMLITIRHGKYFTSYGYVKGVTVSRGQQVLAGQTLGGVAVGADGVGELEFCITQESRFINPALWLKRR